MKVRAIQKMPGKAFQRCCAPIALGLLLFVIAATAADEKQIWKPVRQEVILTIDGEPVKNWEVYLGNKEGTLVLVQLGFRYLRLDTKAREVKELETKHLRIKEREIEEIRGHEGSKEIASTGWVIRDIGRARMVRVRLKAEGRVLEIQFGNRPVFRSLY